MKSLIVFILTLVLIAAMAVTNATAQEVHVPDVNLANAIREALGLGKGARITAAAMRELTGLQAGKLRGGPRITVDLTGLQHATQLEVLILDGSKVSDISALANLTKLRHLRLEGSKVLDISALANLTKLELLWFDETQVSDISALANLTKLRHLRLETTDVSDISVLANLTNLETLWFGDTYVSDISALANLTKLKQLELGGTDVSDISALANLPNLESLGLSGTDVSDISALANLPNLESLRLRDNSLNAAAYDTHIPALQAKGIVVKFSARGDVVDIIPDVNLANARGDVVDIIPDVNLANAIREALGLGEGERITAAAMRELTKLTARKRGIVDLTGLQHATNLWYLDLNNNEVSDISPLANLTGLIRLYLQSTAVSDISVLANHTKLWELDLRFTDVSDISPLANLRNLKWLDLTGTDVSDISPLASLTNLESLGLSGTDVSDISALANRTKLERLTLHYTDVSDVSALANLTKLREVGLAYTDVSDISALASALANAISTFEKRVTVNLTNCPLSPASRTHVSALRAKGIFVTFSEEVPPPPPLTWVLEDSWAGPVGDRFQTVEAIAFAGNNLVFWASGDRLYKWDFEANRAWWQNFNGRDVVDVAVPRNSPHVAAYIVQDNSNEKNWVSLRRTSDLSWADGTRQESALSLSIDEGGRYLAVHGIRNYHIYDIGRQTSFVVEDWANTSSTIGAIAITSGTEFTDYKWRTFLSIWKDWHIMVKQYKFRGNIFLPNISVADNAFTSGPIAVKTGIRETGLIAATPGGSIYYFVPKTSTSTEYTVKSVANSNGEGHKDRAPLTSLAVMPDVPGNDDYFDHTHDAPGRYYATSTAHDDFVCFWHLDTGALAQKLDVGFQSAEIAFSQNNSYMAVANGSVSGGDRRIKIYRWPGDNPGRLAAPAQEVEPAQPTALLSNYPNPFNPETWIPYQLSEAAEVTVTIHASDGKLVRTLELGQVPAGAYSDKGRAAYWDGRNAQGEPVASGVYFYTLTAGDFKATRKMVIRK